MRTYQLNAPQSAVLALVLLAAGAAVYRSRGRQAAPYFTESGIIAGLYSFWQYVGGLSNSTGGAFARGRWIERTERAWHLPSERSAQRLISGHPLAEQAANLYYATAHFTGMGIFLIWLFIRHRDVYGRIRVVLVATTAGCLVVELLPVAPPRLLPELGFVDTAAKYGQSVYHLSGITVDQLSAMPSVHVAWAGIVTWGVILASPSRFRWWILAHLVLTVFFVAATANHFWLDGIVALAIMLVAMLAQRVWLRWMPGRQRPTPRAREQSAAPRLPDVLLPASPASPPPGA